MSRFWKYESELQWIQAIFLAQGMVTVSSEEEVMEEEMPMPLVLRAGWM